MPASTSPSQAIEACAADERMPDPSHADQDSARPALKRARSSYSRKDRSNGVDDKAATSHADTSPTVAAAAAAMDGVEIFSLKHYSQDTLDYPRRRATIACEICRSRKSRCDGTRPKCRLCAELGADCVYREPGIKLDAGDKLILAQLERIEGMLQSSLHSPINGFAGSVSPATSHTASDDLQARKMNGVTSNDFAGGPMPLNGLGTWSANISTIPPHHTTPALHLLQWPVIRDLITRQCDPGVLVRLEMAREPMSFSRHLSVDFTNMSLYTQAFFDKVNVWYAVVNPYTWTQYTQIAATFSFQAGAESCVVLLVMALGEAAHSGISISRLPHGSIPPGMSFFAAAWRILPSLMIKNDVSSAQCHILAAAYLMYLVRPLEAWNLLCNASMKQQLLLSSPHAIPSQLRELNERIFWNALMIESDLLAELDLPQSGIAQLEESMRLPRSFPYDVTSSSADLYGGDDLWYFLAEIALRRLLNRVSHLVYPRKRSAPFTVGSLDPIVAELDFQLDQWYQNLPSSVKFPKDRLPLNNQVQTVLRLRYYACRTIIYRPYIQAVLYDESQAAEASVQDACRKCLEACIRQLEYVTAHHEGHLPYLWQGALSIMSQSLIIMAATLSGALKGLLPPPHQMDAIIAEVVDEVARLAHLAPSLELCAEIVREAQERRLTILGGMSR